MNPVQIAPKGAIRSGFILFAIKAIKVHEQMGEQMTIVAKGGKRVNCLFIARC